ncbi:ABC transporter, phosphonate, periplasmic substrate-binding protein [Aquisphaera giovannonii]|uniref:ABC transporter, phosphonate, periplasmic substrate-binding protein n=1 Tax=Aquisphaera giovannonii TaxID=406548 RepID=A0A5B9WEE9_9BACT|nr:PhnD/SsuA/transferrin family substrate-binding protein [Aquisphaera giovannonii]QEH38917.1 ABC transporter, phosphonate, periplasmic substrate-binding protein [Aquisphaera giovannonii]
MRRSLTALALAGLAGSFLTAATARGADDDFCKDGDGCCQRKASKPALRLGAVAYAPGSVTVFEGLRRYLGKRGLEVDYVLYSNYDALVDALLRKQVDVAWNTPLAHAQFHRKAGNASKTLVMRDVDCDVRSALVVRDDSGVRSLDGLKGKTLIMGSRDAAESTVLPAYYLRQAGLDLGSGAVKVHSLDGEVDLRGNPCSSESHVLKALKDGKGQAGIIGERMWNDLAKNHPDQASGLTCLWITPAFSHCVFTAAKDFDPALAARFTELMLAMDPADEAAAEPMRLEGTRKWVAGSPDGFKDLLKALDSDGNAASPAAPAAADRR